MKYSRAYKISGVWKTLTRIQAKGAAGPAIPQGDYSHPTDVPSKMHLHSKAPRGPPFSSSLYASFPFCVVKEEIDNIQNLLCGYRPAVPYIGSFRSCLGHDECLVYPGVFPLSSSLGDT